MRNVTNIPPKLRQYYETLPQEESQALGLGGSCRPGFDQNLTGSHNVSHPTAVRLGTDELPRCEDYSIP